MGCCRTALPGQRDLGNNIHTVHQLTPELVQWIATANLVVMIDASSKGEPGELHIRPVSPCAPPGAVGTHHTTPEELAALTAGLYDHCPPIVIVTMTGANFDLGEQLSPLIARKLPLVSEAVHQICQKTI